MTFTIKALERKDRFFVIVGLLITLMAVGIASRVANLIVERLIEDRSIQIATDFTNHLVESLKPFKSDGIYSNLHNAEQKVLLGFARKVAHIDRLLIIDAQKTVVYDSLGFRLGRQYTEGDFLEAVRTQKTITRKDNPSDPDLPARHSEYVFEAYSPIIEGGEVLGVLELYFDAGEYAKTLNQAALFCLAVFSIVTACAVMMISLIFSRSMQGRRRDVIAIQQLHGVTERAKQIAEESLAKQKRFLANSAHELRTPLSILKARLDGMNRFDDKDSLISDVDRLTRLVDQLLSVARLESGMVATDDLVDLRKIAKEVISDLVPLALNDGKTINLHAPDKPVHVKCNEFYLGRAIGNLIENALRYTPAGECVDVAVMDDRTIRVADRGPGIPDEVKDRLFEPFVQGRDRKGNAGLGLAIVAETMALHQGSVNIQNREGGGAVFELRL